LNNYQEKRGGEEKSISSLENYKEKISDNSNPDLSSYKEDIIKNENSEVSGLENTKEKIKDNRTTKLEDHKETIKVNQAPELEKGVEKPQVKPEDPSSLEDYKEKLDKPKDVDLEDHKETIKVDSAPELEKDVEKPQVKPEDQTSLEDYKEKIKDLRSPELEDYKEKIKKPEEVELSDHQEKIKKPEDVELSDHQEKLDGPEEVGLSDYQEKLDGPEDVELSDYQEKLDGPEDIELSDYQEKLDGPEDVELSDYQEKLDGPKEVGLSDYQEKLNPPVQDVSGLSDTRIDIEDTRENSLSDFIDTLEDNREPELEDYQEKRPEDENPSGESEEPGLDDTSIDLPGDLKDASLYGDETLIGIGDDREIPLSDYKETIKDDREPELEDYVETLEDDREPELEDYQEKRPENQHPEEDELEDYVETLEDDREPELEDYQEERPEDVNPSGKSEEPDLEDYQEKRTDDRPDGKDGKEWEEGDGLEDYQERRTDDENTSGKSKNPDLEDYIEKRPDDDSSVLSPGHEEDAGNLNRYEPQYDRRQHKEFNPDEDKLYDSAEDRPEDRPEGEEGKEWDEEDGLYDSVLERSKDRPKGEGGKEWEKEDGLYTSALERLKDRPKGEDGKEFDPEKDKLKATIDEILASRNDLDLYYSNIIKFARNQNFSSSWGEKVSAIISAYLSSGNIDKRRVEDFERDLYNAIITGSEAIKRSQHVQRVNAGRDLAIDEDNPDAPENLDNYLNRSWDGKLNSGKVGGIKGSQSGEITQLGKGGSDQSIPKTPSFQSGKITSLREELDEEQEMPVYKLPGFNLMGSLNPNAYLRWVAEKTVGLTRLKGGLRAILLDEALGVLVYARELEEKVLKANRDRLPGNDMGVISDFASGGLKNAVSSAVKRVSNAILGAGAADFSVPQNRPKEGKEVEGWVALSDKGSNNARKSSNDEGTKNSYTLLKKAKDALLGTNSAGNNYSFADNYIGAPSGNGSIRGILTTLDELVGTTPGEVKTVDALRNAIIASPYMTTADKTTSNEFDPLKVYTLDTNMHWEVVLTPFLGLENGYRSYLPPISEINTWNTVYHGINTGYGKWIPINSFELSKSKLTTKTLSLYDGEISYPISMEFTNELRLTFVDDQYKSWRTYFERCMDVSVYNSEIMGPAAYETSIKDGSIEEAERNRYKEADERERNDIDAYNKEWDSKRNMWVDVLSKAGMDLPAKAMKSMKLPYSKVQKIAQGAAAGVQAASKLKLTTGSIPQDSHEGKLTAIDKKYTCIAPYKNITFRCIIYSLTPQKSTVSKYDLLVVLKDFVEERSGDVDGDSGDLTVSFSIVGENPKEDLTPTSKYVVKKESKEFGKNKGSSASIVSKGINKVIGVF